MTVQQDQPRQRLLLACLDEVALVPVLSPMPTTVEAVRDVVSDRPPAVLTAWQRRALRATLPRRALQALSAFRPTAMPSDGAPNPLLEASPGASMREETDRLAASPAEQLGLAHELATKAGRPTAPWMLLHRNPAGWLEDYIAGLELVWAEVRPHWSTARNRLEREAERLQAVSDHGAGGHLTVHGGLPAPTENGDLVLPSHTEASGRLRVSETIQLVPLLANHPAGSWGDDYGDRLLSIRYPLPVHRDTHGEAPPPDSLEALLGGQRAVLLLMLEQARNPGQMAAQLFLTPSGVTHHLSALEAAGLVTRTREGRRVVVRRTDRAIALLALYDRA